MQVLREYYAAHPTAAKSEGEIEAIVDKRREGDTAIPTDRWEAMSNSLRERYGDPLPSDPELATTTPLLAAIELLVAGLRQHPLSILLWRLLLMLIAVQDQRQLDALNNVRAVYEFTKVLR